MKPASPHILTTNGGSSSIKFWLFDAGDPLRRILEGGIERSGLSEATLRMDWIDERRLNPLFWVHDLVLLSKLPRTSSNKLMRRVLRKQYKERDTEWSS